MKARFQILSGFEGRSVGHGIEPVCQTDTERPYTAVVCSCS